MGGSSSSLAAGFTIWGSTAASGLAVNTTSSSISAAFAGFNSRPPGAASSSRVSVILGGAACAYPGVALNDASASFVMAAEPAASVAAVVLRTPMVWRDTSTLSAAYLLQDAAGRPQVALQNLSVTLTLTCGGGTLIAACGVPSATTGKGDCNAAVANASWFSAAASVSCSATVSAGYNTTSTWRLTAASTPFGVTLARVAARSSLATSPLGMYLALPEGPRYVNGSVGPLTVLANTGSHALSSWTLSCTYNASVLRFVTYAADAKFNAPVVNSATSGRVSFATTGKSASASAASVTGWGVSVLQLSFAVVATAPARTHADVLSCAVGDMVNTGTLTFVSQAAAAIGDAHDGWSLAGQLTVAEPAPIGMYAYAASAELLNLAALTGGTAASTTTISARLVYDAPHVADAAPASVACALLAADAAAGLPPLTLSALRSAANVSECVASTTADGSGGVVRVAVSAGLLSASLPLRVWAPLRVRLYSSDRALSPIAGARQPGACMQPLYQSATLSATAVLGGDGLQESPELDFTCLPGLVFASSNASALRVEDGNVARVVAGAAAANITITVAGATIAAPLLLQVLPPSDDAAVAVTAVSTVLVAAASWPTAPIVVTGAGNATVRAAASLALNTLSAEGQAGALAAFASFADGTVTQLTPGDGLSVAVRAAYARSLALTGNADGVTFTASVPAAYAVSVSARDVLRAVWTDACSGAVIAQGDGGVDVALPAALSVSAVAANTTLAAPGSPASAAPLSKPSATQLSVAVWYDGGALGAAISRNFTGDVRTSYALVRGSALAAVSPTGLVTALANASVGGAVVVRVSVRLSDEQQLVADAALHVAGVASLTVVANPSPAFPGSASVNTTSLRRLHCTARYQHANLTLLLTTTDGGVYDVSSAAVFTSSTPAVGAIVGARELAGVAVGTVNVKGTFSGVVSAALAVSVTDEAATVSSLVATFPATFSGVTGVTAPLAVAVRFDDGCARVAVRRCVAIFADLGVHTPI
jgi:hypothetical protein